MKENETHKPNNGGNRGKPLHLLVAVSLITILVIATIGVGSASAAPVGPGGNGSGTGNNGDAWQNKVNNLRGEISVAQSFRTQPGNNKNGNACLSADQARYKDEYMATLRAAQTLAVRGASAIIPNTGNSSNNGPSANGNNGNNGATLNGSGGILNANGNNGYYASHPEKLLAAYLHRLRALRSKMNSTDNNNNSSNASCLGIGTNGTGTGTATGTGTGTGTGSATSTPAAPSTTPTATP